METEIMRITVLDSATLGDDISLKPLAEIGELDEYKNTAPDEVRARIADCDACVVNKIKLNADNLSAAKRLKLICVTATGYDNIDLEYCRRNGIAVCNVVGYSTDSVAQITLATALSLYSHLGEYNDFVKSGEYTKGGVANRLTPVYHELCGKVWGIVGAGNIGKKVARCAEALGCRVIAFKRTPDPALECCDLETLCRKSDIISVHIPLSAETKNLIDREHIAMMKKSVVFINEARGAVTDEAALADALKCGKIGALGVDVYSAEPFGENHPFYEIRNDSRVCLTPHMAWGAYEARMRCIDIVAENIRSFMRGERKNRVD